MSVIYDRELTVRSAIGTDLWVGVVGTGPAMVLCDGLGCDGFVWKHWLPAFRDRFTLVRWHYRGHGKSEVPAYDALTVEGLARDLFLVLDALDIKTAILAGHSMGAQVILEAALQDRDVHGSPHRISATIPLCGLAGRPLDTFKNTNAGLVVVPKLIDLATRYPVPFAKFWGAAVPSKISLFVAKHLEINAKLMSIEDLRPYLERLSVMDPLAFLWMLSHASRHDARPRLPDITTPALIVAAEHDTFTPMALSVSMATEMPNAELFVLPAATHTGPLEWPEMLHLRVDKFLRDNHLPSEVARA